MLAISKFSNAQIVPLSYDGKQGKKTLTKITGLNTPETDTMLIPAVRTPQHTEFLNSNEFSYGKLGVKFEDKANEQEVKINRYYEAKLDSLANKIGATNDVDEIMELKEEIAKMEQKKKDQLKVVKTLDDLSKEMFYRQRTSKEFAIFPVRNAVDAQLFYNSEVKENSARFLKNSIISYSPDGGKASIYNEIYADYAGPIRMGVGVLISNKQNITDSLKEIDTTELQKDAVQRLLGGGGNFTLNASAPLLNYESDFLRSEKFSFKLLFAPKFSVDVPKLGTVKNDYALNCDAGVEGSVFYTLANSVITFFGNYRFGYVFGNSTFYTNIVKDDQKAFSLNSVSLGIALSSTFRINWNYYFGSSFVKENFPSTIGFSIVPN
jgi:hypothetical protein